MTTKPDPLDVFNVFDEPIRRWQHDKTEHGYAVTVLALILAVLVVDSVLGALWLKGIIS